MIKEIGIILIVLGFSAIFLGWIINLISGSHIEKSDCYDKEGSKIIGVECEKEISNMSSNWTWLALGCPLGLVGILLVGAADK